MRFRVHAVVAAIAVLWLGGCAGGSRREPGNLSTHKAELIAYHDSGAHERALGAVGAEATRWIEARAAARKPGERLAVVFDIDETVLSNWANMERDDFGYIPERWHAWVERAEASAIGPVRETFRATRRAEVAVIFLTGRKERDRAGTERNLRAQGMADFAELIVKPEAESGSAAVERETGGEARRWKTAAEFKTAMRRELVASGWTLIANIGDQESDLSGGFAEKTFKLPNPFYLTE